MIEPILLSVLSIVVMILPGILAGLAAKRKEADALTSRSLDELATGAARVRQQPPV